MAWVFHIFSVFMLQYTIASQESTVEFSTLRDPASTQSGSPLAVALNNQHLTQVSSSVLMAETWLRTHVLASYPASNITHIVVGHNLLCFPESNVYPQKSHLVLPALRNLHHSLTRWGLQTEIKVSPSLSSHCLAPHLAHSLTKPLLHFIQTTNSTYLLNPLDQNSEILLHTYLEFLKKIGFLKLGNINFITGTPTYPKPTMRKLSFVQTYPISDSPFPSLSWPIASPPSPSSVPYVGMSPAQSPQSRHHNYCLPPCNPRPAPAPTPVAAEKLWCVAKPSVPAATLQEAMDYACGQGEAECKEIQENGNCYYPDSLVAHASFAFNSYWQKTKNIGGTCDFGGTAMLVNSDPSYLQCKFIVT